MFKRSFRSSDRVDKSARLKKSGTTMRDPQKLSKLQQSLENTLPVKRTLSSPIITLMVGSEGRLFAAHEEVLCQSPFFENACRGQYLDVQNKRISIPDEEPEIFSAVLEYLYKGDYYPRLLHNKHRNSWELEDAVRSPDPSEPSTPRGGRGAVEATMLVPSEGKYLLRDTVVYCAAERFGLEELKRLSLRKQGLQSGIDVGTILRSAQYAYDNTPKSDSRLRAHYLALIIRCRKTFKRSGTMQAEMEKGGQIFFDLFVAMCNHLDDVVDMTNVHTPKTI
ncbi:putative BTB POZ domain-containing protein [Rosellinia necatrix]|uniref:Putative BTB POZ domain-containing protein n=1 Tax=Rosellinia necatrix TaxID=77044 RepID=A0A1W2TT75_ROSNE|nr:putative BTB POZ domain-containing protein [Rosellinia necatrix]